MSATFDASGLAIDTFDAALTQFVVALGASLGLTDAQVERARNSVQSAIGNLARVAVERDITNQEALLAVYGSLSVEAEGSQLDRIARILGVTRRAAQVSRVIGTADGTASTSIPNGTRLRYNPAATVWTVVDGPYTIGGGGTVEIAVESESEDAVEVAIDPATGFDDWTILDSVVGWSDVGGFESTAQPIVGSDTETDAALRGRVETEAFRRATGPIAAIDANVTAVNGVTFVRTWENRTLVTDSDSIPGKAINVVVEGGDDTQVAEAIYNARPAGAEIFALVDGSEVSVTLTDDYGFDFVVAFNRVTDVPMLVEVDLVTSTSEESAPAGIIATVQSLVQEQANEFFGIGADVLPWKIAGFIAAQNYGGIDNVVVRVDSVAGGSPAASKFSISIRERATFALGNINVAET